MFLKYSFPFCEFCDSKVNQILCFLSLFLNLPRILHVIKKRWNNFIHVNWFPNILHKIIGQCFSHNTLQALNSRKSYLFAYCGIIVIGVAHRREFWYKEIVTCVIRRRVVFDVGKFNKLEIERNLFNLIRGVSKVNYD